MRFKLGSTHNSLVINFVLLDLLALCHCDRFPGKNSELVELSSSRHAHRTNTSAHLIFNTVSSLLQHWPNTIYRNGLWFFGIQMINCLIAHQLTIRSYICSSFNPFRNYSLSWPYRPSATPITRILCIRHRSFLSIQHWIPLLNAYFFNKTGFAYWVF